MQQGQIAQVQQFLSSDEHVLWQGTPGKGVLLEKIDYFIIPFIIFWLIIPTKVAIVSISMGRIFEALFSVPFFLVGLYLLVGRFIIKKKIMSKTLYTITDKRIIFIENKKITFIDRGKLPEVSLELLKDGWGTINFKSNLSFFNNFFGYDLLLIGSAYPRMKNIENVQGVWKILNEHQQE